MINLNLFWEQEGRSWTLQPNREYFVGSDLNCEIPLTNVGVDSQHLKFSFDPINNVWYVHNLSVNGIFINNQRITNYPIGTQTRILVTNLVNLVATPETSNTTTVQQPQAQQLQASTWTAPMSATSNIVTGTGNIQRATIVNNIQEITIEKFINRGFFDREHPEELRGYFLRGFSISNNQDVDWENQSKLTQVRHDLYEEIYKTLVDFKKHDSYLEEKLYFRIVKYIDYKYQISDRERLYIEIVLDTIRNTKISTLCRFFINGNNLYIAADSYALGRLKKRNLIFQTIILLILIPSLPGLFAFFIVPGIIALWYLYSVWIKFIRTLFQGESFMYALRINFQNKISNNSFDLDDTSIFLKSLFPLIIESLKKILKKHNMLSKQLEEYLEEISKNIGGQTINIDTGGGGIFGSIFGSANSKVNN
ncbi:MAG: FHA domain-containing protein [Iphinoe sp. HA4291-MV1]|jgi:hypothetical protein|nr:FHA domain-containing protein [Iphinoe sp. HA4291-MV1]